MRSFFSVGVGRQYLLYRSDSGITADELIKEVASRTSTSAIGLNYTPQVYDSLYAVAKAVNSTIERLGNAWLPEDFVYGFNISICVYCLPSLK